MPINLYTELMKYFFNWHMKMQMMVIWAVMVLTACGVSNAPVPPDWLGQNVLFSSYAESPKYLDSTSSYSNNETPWTYAVYEPPLKYHYLKRPYELQPRTLTELPRVTYLNKQGQQVPAQTPAAQIAESVFELNITPGIQFQPHPAFAKDGLGQALYLQLKEADLEGKRSPYQFEKMGSRELVADDYLYAIKRLATPRIKSPSFGFLSEKIVGLADYGKKIKEVNSQIKSGKSARELGPFGHLPWLDFREHAFEGVQVTGKYSLRIRVNGKYPQFKYWLAMTFFAPVAWEVDAFYAQPGMSRRNLNADTWPVGTGPYMLTDYVPNARMVLERNPNYRKVTYPCEGEAGDKEKGLLKDCGKKLPFIDKVVSVIEKEGTSVATKFIQGYYDVPQLERGEPGIGYQVSIQDGTGMAKELLARKIQLPSTIQVGFYHFGFNWLDPVVGAGKTPDEKVRNRKLRQALSIAFDFEEYVSVFEEDRAEVNQSVVVPGLFGHDQTPFNPVIYERGGDGKVHRKSIEKAKALLAEAGYPNGRDAQTGKPLVINYDSQGVGPGYKARIDWVAKQFAKLNIELEVRSTDYNRFQDKMRKGSAQFFFWGWLADYPDPENFMFLLYGPNSKVKFDGENSTNYVNAEYDQLFDKMKDLDDTPERAALIKRMIEISQEDAPLLNGWSEEFGGAYHQWVFNGKPSNIIRDQLAYLRIDPALRQAKIKEWNQAVLWPLVLAPILLLLLAIPAWRGWKKRQHQRAVVSRGES
jgi:ABC-type transport system substrate-binding protein